MAKGKMLGLEKNQKSKITLPKVIRKKSLRRKGKKTMVPKTEKFGGNGFVPNVPNDDHDDDDDDGMSDEDVEFIEKTRMGESFPINTSPMEEESGSDDERGGKKGSHSMDLDHLIENDPDFYQYLLKNEKSLLEFEEEEEEVEEEEEEGALEDVKVTDKLLRCWSTELKKGDRKVIRQIISVLKRGVDEVRGKSGEEIEIRHKISSEHFNDIMKLCFLDMTPALFKSIGLDPPIASDVEVSKYQGEGDSKEVEVSKRKKQKKSVEIDPSKCPGWKKMVGPIKTYLNSILSVLNSVTNESLTCSILRHCLHLIPFVSCYPHLVKRYLDKITNLWSSERSEKVRILSFLFILRLLKRDGRLGQKSEKSDQKSGKSDQKSGKSDQKSGKSDQKSKKSDQKSGKSDITTSCNQLDTIVRKMYLSFVKNSRVTNVETWPFINFMKQCLIELYSLDQGVCYGQTFVFLRQTAINVRNGMSSTGCNGHKNVYNWPFIHSLCLWQQLLTTLHPSPVLKPLIYPLVQIIIGTIHLSPNGQLLPVKFHLIRSLIQLSKETNHFIPIAHLILDTLDLVHYESPSGGKKAKKETAGKRKKRVDFNSIIKVSKGDSSDPVFREEVVKTIFTLLLQYFSSQSHRISFPEISFATTFKLKRFMKDKCKSANDGKLLKQLVEKIEENNRFIINRRKTIDFKFNDIQAVNKWENEIKQEANEICPITVFYNKWKKIRETKERREMVDRKKLIQEKRNKKKKKNLIEDGMIESDNDDGVDEEDELNTKGENDFDEEMEEEEESDGEEAELIYDDEDEEDESD